MKKYNKQNETELKDGLEMCANSAYTALCKVAHNGGFLDVAIAKTLYEDFGELLTDSFGRKDSLFQRSFDDIPEDFRGFASEYAIGSAMTSALHYDVQPKKTVEEAIVSFRKPDGKGILLKLSHMSREFTANGNLELVISKIDGIRKIYSPI